MAGTVVVDASAMVDVLVGSELARSVRRRLADNEMHAPAHFDAEVLSALGRIHRGGGLPGVAVAERLTRLATSPIERHFLARLVEGAWTRRPNLRLADALYVELAAHLGAPLVTTDRGLAIAAPDIAELVTPE